MYLKVNVGDVARIARNLQNMEGLIFGPKPARHFHLDNKDFDLVDNNDNIPSNIES